MFFFSSRRRHTRWTGDWSSDVCSSDLAEHEMVKGWVGKVHSHPHEQIVYVVHGHLKVTCQGKSFDVRTGDTFVVRGGVEHGASATEDSLVIDVFTPCREDYVG